MAVHITDAETNRLVRQLADARGISLSEAVKLAVQHELRNAAVMERLRPMQDRIQSQLRDDRPRTEAEWKAFYDDLEGEAVPSSGEADRSAGSDDTKSFLA